MRTQPLEGFNLEKLRSEIGVEKRGRQAVPILAGKVALRGVASGLARLPTRGASARARARARAWPNPQAEGFGGRGRKKRRPRMGLGEEVNAARRSPQRGPRLPENPKMGGGKRGRIWDRQAVPKMGPSGAFLKGSYRQGPGGTNFGTAWRSPNRDRFSLPLLRKIANTGAKKRAPGGPKNGIAKRVSYGAQQAARAGTSARFGRSLAQVGGAWLPFRCVGAQQATVRLGTSASKIGTARRSRFWTQFLEGCSRPSK